MEKIQYKDFVDEVYHLGEREEFRRTFNGMEILKDKLNSKRNEYSKQLFKIEVNFFSK